MSGADGQLLAWVFVLAGLAVLAYGGMLRGRRWRTRRDRVEPLAPTPARVERLDTSTKEPE